MLINEEELRTEILGKLKDWVAVLPDPDKPLVGTLVGEETLSARDIVQQVENRTPKGDEFVRHWIRLAVNHVMTSALLRNNEDK